MSKLINKIAYHKKILSLVNELPLNNELHGITRSAIQKWKAENPEVPNSLIDTLINLDEKIGGIFNTSEGVAVISRCLSEDEINTEIDSLRNLLEIYSAEACLNITQKTILN